MILVTVGTNEQPFDRLVRAAADLRVDEPLFVQHGSSQIDHGPGEWVDFLPFDVLAERMREARVVVCHAGVGSIMLARRCGRRPIVVPRRGPWGEAVDDHQVPVAQRLARSGLVTLVEDETQLASAIARQDDGVVTATFDLPGADGIGHDVRAFLEGVTRPLRHAA